MPFGAKGFHGKMGVKSTGIPNISKRHDEIAHKSYYGRKDFRSKINNAVYSHHDNKHLKARTAEEAKRFSETGKRNAQYLPEINNKVLEKEALQKDISLITATIIFISFMIQVKLLVMIMVNLLVGLGRTDE
ncbi:hypothetical protein ACEQPO_15395 [Bacillus sp. SL00103]